MHPHISILLVFANFADVALSAKNRSQQDLIALITVNAPESLAESFPGVYALFSAPPPQDSLTLWVPDGDPEGCKGTFDKSGSASRKSSVAILRRGTCGFVEKALRAQEAGAAGLIVVSDSDNLSVMGGSGEPEEALEVSIFVVEMAKSEGQKLINWVKQSPSGPAVEMKFSIYRPSVWDLPEFILMCLATSLVVAGAFFSTADLREGSPLAPGSAEEVIDINGDMAGQFCVMGSIMLVVLFFLMRYMIYFIIFAFCLGGFSCTTQLGSFFISHMFPSLRRGLMKLPEIGEISMADLVASIPSAIVVVCWLLLRNNPESLGWLFQDIIGSGFLCMMQRTLRLPNIKVATLLLSCMFFFDIFWVFISPVLFGQSVMVGVATGGGTGETVPMLLRMPSFNDALGRDRMLGFGDVVLPGLLCSYLRRHDVLGNRSGFRGYFVPSVIGYFVGLCATVSALMIMEMGQPALLYLVPGTLGTTLVLGLIRGEIANLWEGTPKSEMLLA